MPSADSLYLRKGLLANLADAPKVPGAISITTDERAMYLDLSETERIRLGDFIQVANTTELYSAKYQPYSTTALYYVEDVNGLYKYTGTAWKLINEPFVLEDDVNFDHINNTLNAQSQAISQINNSLTELDTAIDDVESDLADEISRANAAEQSLDSKLTAETERASGAENLLSQNISSLSTSLSATNNSLTQEITRAKAAEQNLSQSISTLGDDIDATNNDLSGLASEVAGNIDLLGTQVLGVSQNLSTLRDDVTTANTTIRNEFANADTALEKKITQAYESYVSAAISTADAMVFMGVLNDVSEMPTSGVKKGHTYKVGTFFVYDTTPCYVGDLLIANDDQEPEEEEYSGTWAHVSSGYENDYDAIISGSEEQNSITLKSGVGAPRGTIQFVNEQDGGLNFVTSVSSSYQGDSVTVSASLVWGSF